VTEQVEVQLPTTLREATRIQIGLTFAAPYEALITVGINGALMSAAWFLLPTSLKDDLFTLHGTLAFALVLASWMYSDVPATNVLGPDAQRIVAALDDPVMFRRLILAKNIALWMLVSPVCALVALGVGLSDHDPLATLYTIVWIVIVPFGFLAISAWVGYSFPIMRSRFGTGGSIRNHARGCLCVGWDWPSRLTVSSLSWLSCS